MPHSTKIEKLLDTYTEYDNKEFLDKMFGILDNYDRKKLESNFPIWLFFGFILFSAYLFIVSLFPDVVTSHVLLVTFAILIPMIIGILLVVGVIGFIKVIKLQ